MATATLIPPLERYDTAKAKAQAIIDRAKSEDRDMNDAEQAEFDTAIADAKSAKAQHDRNIKSDQDLADLGDPITPAVKAAGGSPAGKSAGLTPGEIFVKSEPWTALDKTGFSDDTPIVMPNVGVGELKAMVKTLVTDPALYPTRIEVGKAPVIISNVLQAFTIVPDSGEVIKHMTASFTNNAAVVAEGAAKPESALTWTPETLNPATIAHHIPVTVQALRRNSQLETIINTFMVDGVVRKVAASAVATLAASAAVTLQAFATDLRTTIRKAITKAGQYGTPTGILLNAFDAETVDLEAIVSAALGPGQYYAPAESVWRLPIFTTYDLPAGFAYVGDLKQVMVYTDGPVQLATGWIGNQFIENKLTIRAEQDAVTGIMLAPSIVKADLTL